MVSVEFIQSNEKQLFAISSILETMAFKLITVLCATLAFTNAGLLTQTAYSAPATHYAAAPVAHYSSAPAVSHVYSSIGAVSHQPAVIAHGKPFKIQSFFVFSLRRSLKLSG